MHDLSYTVNEYLEYLVVVLDISAWNSADLYYIFLILLIFFPLDEYFDSIHTSPCPDIRSGEQGWHEAPEKGCYRRASSIGRTSP